MIEIQSYTLSYEIGTVRPKLAEVRRAGLQRCGYAAVCLLRPLRSAEDATQAGCGVRMTRRGYRSATSTHETISSSIELLLLLSGANY